MTPLLLAVSSALAQQPAIRPSAEIEDITTTLGGLTLVGGSETWSSGGGGASVEARAAGTWSRAWGQWRLDSGGSSTLQLIENTPYYDRQRVRLGVWRNAIGARASSRFSLGQKWAESWLSMAGRYRTGRFSAETVVSGGLRGSPGVLGPAGRGELTVSWNAGSRVRIIGLTSAELWGKDTFPSNIGSSWGVRLRPTFAISVTPYIAGAWTANKGFAPAGFQPAGTLLGRIGVTGSVRLHRNLDLTLEAATWTLGGTSQLAGVRAVGGLTIRAGRVKGARPPQGPGERIFTFSAEGATSVSIQGSFSDWSPIPMRQENGIWTASIDLEPGRYEYIYVVDGEPVLPPDAQQLTPDGFGGMNAVLVVSPLEAP